MYVVWTKQEYNDLWSRRECTTEEEVKAEILAAEKSGEDLEITLPVSFEVEVKVKLRHPSDPMTPAPRSKKDKDKKQEEVKVEDQEGGPPADQDPGDESNSPV